MCNSIPAKLVLSIFLIMTFTPEISYAQPAKTFISDILKEPDEYDGKMVEIEGTVSTLQCKLNARTREGYYCHFVLKDSNGSLNIFVGSYGSTMSSKAFKAQSIKDNDRVTVKGVYQKAKRVGLYCSRCHYNNIILSTFYNEIDASEVELLQQAIIQ
jgi:hypothetical protein